MEAKTNRNASQYRPLSQGLNCTQQSILPRSSANLELQHYHRYVSTVHLGHGVVYTARHAASRRATPPASKQVAIPVRVHLSHAQSGWVPFLNRIMRELELEEIEGIYEDLKGAPVVRIASLVNGGLYFARPSEVGEGQQLAKYLSCQN